MAAEQVHRQWLPCCHKHSYRICWDASIKLTSLDPLQSKDTPVMIISEMDGQRFQSECVSDSAYRYVHSQTAVVWTIMTIPETSDRCLTSLVALILA